MAIPPFQDLMLPLLRLADRGDVTIKDCVGPLAAEFHLTEEELQAMLPSRRAKRFYNRVAWAKSHLAQAGLIDGTRRGIFQATERGREVLRNPPPRIDIAFLMRYAEYVRFREGSGEEEDGGSPDAPGGTEPPLAPEGTPDERIDAAVEEIGRTVRAEVLRAVVESSDKFLERLTRDLMHRMGYGGLRPGAARVVGGTGDGGIDVIVNEDALGLGLVCVQCKRYAPDRSVDVPEVRAFSGALDGRGAKKGVFVTTSRFTEPARRFVQHLGDKKIVLIDGEDLARRLVEHNLGVQVQRTIEIKRLDRDQFEAEGDVAG